MVRSPKTETEWEQYYLVRYNILRKPWGMKMGSEKDEKENFSEHAAYFVNNKIVAVGRIQMNTETQAQIRYMAVDPLYQGRKYGREIVDYLESKAVQNKAMEIVLEARENAVGFYVKCGYILQNKSYLMFDSIQHYTMIKYFNK